MKNILISRTDSIGDVALTLPMCAWLKTNFPACNLVYLGKEYTRSVVACFQPVNSFESLENLKSLTDGERDSWFQRFDVVIHVFPNKEVATWAKNAKVPVRIGTAHRLFHWTTCNKRPSFTRKNSDLHESQLNFHLLKPLGCDEIPTWDTIISSTNQFKSKSVELPTFCQNITFSETIILHPKSQGSAVEWPLQQYISLAEILVGKGFTVLFTGSAKEGESFRELLPSNPKIIDGSGKFTLEQLIFLIGQCRALVACSTGPYHLAALSGIQAIGLFSPRRPIHPGRWKAIGLKAYSLVFDENCEECKKGKTCACISKIPVQQIIDLL